MSKQERKFEEEKREVINLVQLSCGGRETAEVEVLGTRYRVLKYMVDAPPKDFLTAYTSPVLRDKDGWLCVRCGGEIHEDDEAEEVSRWTPFLEVLCESCRASKSSEKVRPHCTICHSKLHPLLPFSLYGELRIVWGCPLHHMFVIGDMEGI